MPGELSSATLLTLTTALSTTARESASSPQLGQELLEQLLGSLPALDGAALAAGGSEGAAIRASSGATIKEDGAISFEDWAGLQDVFLQILLRSLA